MILAVGPRVGVDDLAEECLRLWYAMQATATARQQRQQQTHDSNRNASINNDSNRDRSRARTAGDRHGRATVAAATKATVTMAAPEPGR